jgi:hypothetical protein
MLVKEAEEDIDERILQKLADKKFSLYTEHLDKELPKVDVPVQVINAIILLLRLFTVISRKDAKYSKEKERRRKAAV